MKKLLIGLVLTSMTAQAQTSSVSTSTVQATSTSATSTTNTSTQSLATAAPAAKKFGVNVIIQTWTGVADLKEHNSNAPIDSLNGIGINYKLSDKLKTEIRHNFSFKTAADRELLKDAQGNIPDSYKMADPTIHLNYASDLRLFGSNPLYFGNRYYVPVSESSRDKTSLGTLRTQTSLDWDLNPKWSVSALAQARLTGYRDYNGKGGTGADSVLMFITGVGATYNFSDKISAYYQPYFVTESTAHNRGQLVANRNNLLYQELGLNFTAGKWTINPAMDTSGSALGEEGYKGMGDDANSTYYMNVFASF